jgi:hypothetical protein
MFNECRHILVSGQRCKAALRGQSFCYWHTTARRYANAHHRSRSALASIQRRRRRGVQIAV